MVSRDTQVKTRQDAEYEYLLCVLATIEGRHVLNRILGLGNIYGDISMDPAVAQRQLGRRDMALDIRAELLTANPKIDIIMASEAMDFDLSYPVKANGDQDGDSND